MKLESLRIQKSTNPPHEDAFAPPMSRPGSEIPNSQQAAVCHGRVVTVPFAGSPASITGPREARLALDVVCPLSTSRQIQAVNPMESTIAAATSKACRARLAGRFVGVMPPGNGGTRDTRRGAEGGPASGASGGDPR